MSARLVKNINPSGSSSPDNLISIDGFLYFAADLSNDGGGGEETSINDQPINQNEEVSDTGEGNGGTDTELNESGTDKDTDTNGNDSTTESSDSAEQGTETEQDSIDDNTSNTSDGNQINNEQPVGLWKSDGSEGGTVLVKAFSAINNLVEANGILYFTADSGEGFEVWSSDGTTGGTKKLKALYPGADGFAANNLFVIDDVLFFSADDALGPDDGENGYEIWRWEGNDVGTKIFRNLFPNRVITEQIIEVEEEEDEDTGIITRTETLNITTAEISKESPLYSDDFFPGNFTDAGNGNFFFTGYTVEEFKRVDAFAPELNFGGLQLWFSDGTEAGTRPIRINSTEYSIYEVRDIRVSPPSLIDKYIPSTGIASSFPRELQSFNNQLYLVANDGTTGFELWSVSNQGENEKLVQDIYINGNSSPQDLTVVNDRLYFTANDGRNGRGLYFISKANNKPTRLANSGEKPSQLSNVNGTLYYSAYSPNGREPWRVRNGKAEAFQDINPGPASSNPSSFTAIRRGSGSKQQHFVYFNATDGKRGVELWSLNLNEKNAKAQRATDIFSGPTSSDPREIINSDQNLFFTADDGKTGRELWTLGPAIKGPTGGRGAGSSQIKVRENQDFIYQFTTSTDDPTAWSTQGGEDADLFKIKSKNGKLYFKEDPDYENPLDVDRDNIYQVVVRVQDKDTSLSSYQYVNVEVLNVKESGPNDGQISDDPSSQEDGNNQDVNQEEGSNANNDPSSETEVERKLVKNIGSGRTSSDPKGTITFNKNLLFAANNGKKGSELWVSEGTSGTTKLLQDIYPGKNSSSPNGFTELKQTLYFAAEDESSGVELWQTNGTKKGTKQTADIRPGSASSSPSNFAALTNRLLFGANDGENGAELWKYNSKKQKASLVKDISSTSGSNPQHLTNYQQEIYFAADDDIYGRELWVSDGSGKGTRMFFDIAPGGFSSNPENLTLFNNKLFFTAKNNFSGLQIWSSDGSTGGTEPLIRRASEFSYLDPDDLTATNTQLFLSAETYQAIPETEDGGEDEGSDSNDGSTARISDGQSMRKRTKDLNPLNPSRAQSTPLQRSAQLRSDTSNINSYNENIDRYKETENCDWVDSARWSAIRQLEEKNDPSLARDWNNKYANPCEFTKLVVPSNTISKQTASNFNSYNRYIDKYKKSNNCDWIDFARSSAIQQMERESDETLARDWNINYANQCSKTRIIIDTGNSSSSSSGTPVSPSTGTQPGTSETDSSAATNPSSAGVSSSAGPFGAPDNSNNLGRELWTTQGSKDSLTLVMDINPGAGSSNPTALTAIDNLIYFSADDGVHGEELWQSDGTEAGTIRLTDINPGAKNSSPRDIEALDGSIYFSATQDQKGRELWRINPSGEDQNLTRMVKSRRGAQKLQSSKKTKDAFIFNLPNEFGNQKADHITNFRSSEGDQIHLEREIFKNLKSINLVTVSSKQQLNAQKKQASNIIYFEPKGQLYFNSNNSRPGFGEDGGLFAIVQGGPDLAESNFAVI